MTYVHQHVSELPDPGGVVECTWATGVELARAALAGSSKQPPATAAEREALRVAGSGSDTKGSTYPQLAAGLAARYGLHVTPTLALPATEIGEGVFLGVQGLYSHLPVHFQRWGKAFAATGSRSSHSVVIYKVGGILRICDPLVPWDSSWHGETIPWAAVVAYHTPLLLGARVIAVKLPTPPVTATGGTDVLAVVKDITRFKVPRIFTTKVGVLNGYDPAKPGVVVKTATYGTASTASFDAAVSIEQFPDASVSPHGAPFLHVTNGTFAGLYIVSGAVTADLTPDAASVVAPPVPDVKHTVTLQFDGGTVFTKVV